MNILVACDSFKDALAADGVCHAIAKVLETVTAPECSNDFAHAGYEPT